MKHTINFTMINRLCFFLTIIALVTHGRLAAQSVKTDYDTKTNFDGFTTYAWLAPGDSVLNRYRKDKVFGGFITYRADTELRALGFRQDTLRPQAIFMFFTSVEEITHYSQSPTLSLGIGVGGPGYYVSAAGPVAGGKVTATTEENGMLKYVMYNAANGKMIWSGMVNKTFKPTDDIEDLISDYTAKIFKKFPRKRKK
jgi:hypothetical protein